MEINKLHASSAGTADKQDVLVTLEPTDGETEIVVCSPVKRLYGAAIVSAVTDILEQYHIQHCRVEITDQSALDFVIRARVETAVCCALKESTEL